MKENHLKTCLSKAILLASMTTTASVQSFEIEEVTVTAQKRAESLQDVPISVSALGSSDLEGLKLRASTEIAAQVPNLQISTPYGDAMPMFSMRGISMSDFSLNQSSPVAIYVDEVFRGNPAIQGVQMFDLERVEVLRGPQGTLYGKNTTGGAVNFITKAPTHETEGYLNVGLGDFDRKELQGAYQTSLIDNVLSVRAAGTWTEADGYNENKLVGQKDLNAIDEWGARITFSYTPTDDLEMILRIASSDQTPTNFVQIADNIPAGGLGVGGIGFTGYNRAGLDKNEVEVDYAKAREVETDAISLTINYDLSEALTLTSITSWDDGRFYNPEDVDGSPNDVVHLTYESEMIQWAQDFRITSNLDGPFNFITGLYLSKDEIKATNQIDLFHVFAADTTDAGFGAPDGAIDAADCVAAIGVGAFDGCTQYNKYTQERNSIAAYFNSTYDINEALTLNFGLRYTEDETKMSDFSADVRGLEPGNVDNAYAYGLGIRESDLADDSFTDREWSGKVGLDYTTEEGTLLYASYSKGYRSGAFNGSAFLYPSDVSIVDPETLDAYEVGFKSQILDNTVQLNGAVFYYEYSDQQFLNVDSTTAAQTLVSIESSTIAGAELELTARPLEQLMLKAGVGWLDTKVDKGTLAGINLKGKELLAAPELNLNISADYDIDLGDTGVITLHADASFVDKQHFDIFNTESIKGDDYWLSNARIAFEPSDSSYTLAAWIKNIEDKNYTTQAIAFPDFGFDYFQLGAPRSIGVEATLRF